MKAGVPFSTLWIRISMGRKEINGKRYESGRITSEEKEGGNNYNTDNDG